MVRRARAAYLLGHAHVAGDDCYSDRDDGSESDGGSEGGSSVRGDASAAPAEDGATRIRKRRRCCGMRRDEGGGARHGLT
jgi:hypothetical protein